MVVFDKQMSSYWILLEEKNSPLWESLTALIITEMFPIWLDFTYVNVDKIILKCLWFFLQIPNNWIYFHTKYRVSIEWNIIDDDRMKSSRLFTLNTNDSINFTWTPGATLWGLDFFDFIILFSCWRQTFKWNSPEGSWRLVRFIVNLRSPSTFIMNSSEEKWWNFIRCE